MITTLYWIIGITLYLMCGVLNIRFCVGEVLAMVTYGSPIRQWLYLIWALVFWFLGPYALLPLAYIDEFISHRYLYRVRALTPSGVLVFLCLAIANAVYMYDISKVLTIVFFILQLIFALLALENIAYRFPMKYRRRRQKPIGQHLPDNDISAMYPSSAPKFDDHGRQKS